MLLSDKSVVITGAGSGVGRASSLLFAGEGAKVVCADVQDEWAEETVRLVTEAGGVAVAQHCDVTDEGDVEKTVALAVNEFGRLDVMYNSRCHRAQGRRELRGLHSRRLRAPHHDQLQRVQRVQMRGQAVQDTRRRRRDREHRFGRGHGQVRRVICARQRRMNQLTKGMRSRWHRSASAKRDLPRVDAPHQLHHDRWSG
jgi:NADPH:quinone reductase-like Zn-dependent oxidoreductase